MSLDEEIYTGRIIYIWTPGSDACPACLAMKGIWDEKPDEPHPNCDCTVESAELVLKKVAEFTEELPIVHERERISTIPKGGNITEKKTWSTSFSGGGKVSGEQGELSFSGSASEGSSQDVTFNYDDEEGGPSQVVFAEFEVRRKRITSYYVPHWSEYPADLDPIEASHIESERVFIGYEQVSADKLSGAYDQWTDDESPSDDDMDDWGGGDDMGDIDDGGGGDDY
jgi:hypothetical protein